MPIALDEETWNDLLAGNALDDLEAIIGEPRIVAIFRSISGNGNNAEYTKASHRNMGRWAYRNGCLY